MAAPHYQGPDSLAADVAVPALFSPDATPRPLPLTLVNPIVSPLPPQLDADWQPQPARHFSGRAQRRERDGMTVYESRRKLAGRQAALVMHLPQAMSDTAPALIQWETGFGTEPTDYQPLARELGRRGLATAMSRPEGLGNPLTALSYKRELAGEYAEYLSQTLGFGDLVLAGYSMGGDIAAHGAAAFAGRHPDKLKLLVSLCSVGYQDGQNLLNLVGQGLPRMLARELPGGSRRNPLMAARLANNFRKHGPRLLAEGIGIGIDGCKATALAGQLEAAGVVVEHLVAETDAFCDPADRRRTIQRQRQHSIGPGSTHLAPLDQPEMTADALDEAINAHYPRGRWLRPSLSAR